MDFLSILAPLFCPVPTQANMTFSLVTEVMVRQKPTATFTREHKQICALRSQHCQSRKYYMRSYSEYHASPNIIFLFLFYRSSYSFMVLFFFDCSRMERKDGKPIRNLKGK